MIDLADVPLFAGLRPVELAKIVAELDGVSLPPGGVVFRRGEPGDCLYVVRAGVAEARAGTGADSEYPLTLYGPGDSFGESALLTDEPRSSTVVALDQLELWALAKSRFLALVEQTPGLALAVGRAVSRRLQATHEAVSSLHRAFDAVGEQAYLGLDPELQRFLRRSAPLEPVRPEVVARALGRPDAEQVLRYLEARLSFVARDEDGSFHFHRLFRELLDDKLRLELGEQGRRDWLRHLAECALASGQVEQAVRVLAESDDLGAAEQLASTQAAQLLAERQLDRAELILAALPGSLEPSTGPLAEVRAELLAARGRPAEAVALLEASGLSGAELTDPDEVKRQARRFRRLAELSYQLGRTEAALRWLGRADALEANGDRSSAELEQLVAVARRSRDDGSTQDGWISLASLAGLRRVSEAMGALGGSGFSRPLGVGLSLVLLVWFFTTDPPEGLSPQGYQALGLLAGALPLLVFSVLADHLVSLLLVAGWAGLRLVPAPVALSGFASPGWFLVLAVLGVGVALARAGLLYRLVLWLLSRLPANHALVTLALAGAGLVFSPAMPNATARTALAAPLALEISDTLGYPHRSRGSAAVGLAMLLGFGQMCTLFLTGSSSGLLVHSLLPLESQARFGWVGWFVAAAPLHLIIFAITYAAVLVRLRPERPPVAAPERLQAQRRILGPLSRLEWSALVVFALLVVAFVAGPAVGLEAAWAAVLAMAALSVLGVLDQQGFRSGINWSFLIFFGAMLSLAEVFSTLGIDVWLAAAAARPLAPLAANPMLFLVALALVGYVLNLFVRWQAACVLMTLVLIPVVAPLGIEPWVVGMTALVTTNMWFLPYQSTIYQALYYGTDEQVFTHAQARPIALVYGLACIIGLVASVPYWQAIGLLPR